MDDGGERLTVAPFDDYLPEALDTAPDRVLTARFDRIKKLSDELVRVQHACAEAKAFAALIQHEVEKTRAAKVLKS